MGGPGAGHRSVEATLSRLENIQKARAARKRPPLPWRSAAESRIIEQLVWQWFLETRSSRLEAGERQKQIPRRSAPRNDNSLDTEAGGVRRDSANRAGAASSAPTKTGVALHALGQEGAASSDKNSDKWRVTTDEQAKARNTSGTPTMIVRPQTRPACAKAAAGRPATAGRPWAKVRVARFLGVSHTWVNRLVKRIEADPYLMHRKMMAFAPANYRMLEQAREETLRLRRRGEIRGPMRWRRVKITLQGRKQKMIAPTRSEQARREKAARAPAIAGRLILDAPVIFAELPAWARGFILPGASFADNFATGVAIGSARDFAKNSRANVIISDPVVFRPGSVAGFLPAPPQAQTPRPVKFARRRYRR